MGDLSFGGAVRLRSTFYWQQNRDIFVFIWKSRTRARDMRYARFLPSFALLISQVLDIANQLKEDTDTAVVAVIVAAAERSKTWWTTAQ